MVNRDQGEPFSYPDFQIHYERLVLTPESEMRRILAFLDLPWSDDVLHHEQFVGSNELRLSPYAVIIPGEELLCCSKEFSTDQVVKPINLGALGSWFGYYNDELLAKLPTIAPMLAVLGKNRARTLEPKSFPGYNTNTSTPDYRELVRLQRNEN
jgi:hypothetical protein